MGALDKQVYIYSLGTECFYTDEEYLIHKKLLKLYALRKSMKDMKNKKSTPKYKLDKCKRILKKVNARIDYKKSLLKYEFENFTGIRVLREETLTQNKVIGIFDSALTRTINMKIDSLSEDLFVVRAFYFNILEDIINNGFVHNGEHYIYFSSSAGQIRTKKTVFIKKILWETHENTLSCGLTVDAINDKGGCNVNKLLAYKALISSASEEWKNFNIDRAIVVPDLCSPITSTFDYIDRETYNIERKELTVELEHTDGCGMILPSKSKKSFMVRLPYVKGLLVPFDFKKFAIESENTKVTDIYGKIWDVIEDKIEVIFTKSQFKMAKYYQNWLEYQENFKKFNCKANKLNEEDISSGATLNYQMLQTLTDTTDDELKLLAHDTVEDIKNLHYDKETILRMLGADYHNRFKSPFQKALEFYPELINDSHTKRILKDKKKSMMDDAVSGKLSTNGKYLYIIPDLYAFCEFLFNNIQHPKGILDDGEVYTSVYGENKLDILRSPHLYKEHAIRKNVKRELHAKWFVSKGIYISIHDSISRILQCDFDGDKVLTVEDDLLVSIAERNMQGIVPLYYEMATAPAEIITNDKIYESLTNAFKANIGEVSNNITKIFNSSNEIDIEVVKWLTAENNYIID